MSVLSFTGKAYVQSAKKIAVGVFDGLHCAHKRLLEHADTLLSFYPHPDIVTKKRPNLSYLSTRKELRVLYKRCIRITFNQTLMRLSAETFCQLVFKDLLNINEIIVGEDFKYGYKQLGNPETLKSWGKQHHINVKIIPLLCNKQHIPIKSSLIRQCLHENFNQAIDYLGHPYLIIGKVIHGEKRGRLLGFPTANLSCPSHKCLPHHGVYKGYVHYQNKRLPAIVYIGNQPTFNGKKRHIEVHLVQQSHNLYGQYLHLYLETLIRLEINFSSVEALKEQIKLDIAKHF